MRKRIFECRDCMRKRIFKCRDCKSIISVVSDFGDVAHKCQCGCGDLKEIKYVKLSEKRDRFGSVHETELKECLSCDGTFEKDRMTRAECGEYICENCIEKIRDGE